MTNKPTNVVEALSAVMAELPAIGKDSKADPRQGGYAYRGIEAITSHTQSLFAKHGVVFVPRVVSHEIRDIVVNDKPWTDTVALVEYDVYGPGGTADKITVGPILAIGRDNSDKGGNKCLTQAFKYALIQALCISDSADDADADSGSPERDARSARTDSSGAASSLGKNVPAPELVHSRVKEVGALVEASADVTVDDVVAICADLSGVQGTKVNDLSDEQYAALLIRLGELSKAS